MHREQVRCNGVIDTATMHSVPTWRKSSAPQNADPSKVDTPFTGTRVPLGLQDFVEEFLKTKLGSALALLTNIAPIRLHAPRFGQVGRSQLLPHEISRRQTSDPANNPTAPVDVVAYYDLCDETPAGSDQRLA